MSAPETLGGDLEQALADIHVPSYVIDDAGVIRWVNPAAERIVGDVRGRQFTSVVVPEERVRARRLFGAKIAGLADVTDASTQLVGADGTLVDVQLSSVPLRRGGHAVGVFGQLLHHEPAEPPPHLRHMLTPRQAEVLGLLARGRSTTQMATDLRLSPETVRNHVRHILRRLNVSSRLEAVAVAHGERPLDRP